MKTMIVLCLLALAYHCNAEDGENPELSSPETAFDGSDGFSDEQGSMPEPPTFEPIEKQASEGPHSHSVSSSSFSTLVTKDGKVLKDASGGETIVDDNGKKTVTEY